MVFVKRDAENIVCAILENNYDDQFEELETTHPDVLAFMARCALPFYFLKSDLELIRVLEDLIQILMDKHIISITDFPPQVVEKLASRQKIRSQILKYGHIIDE